MIISNYEDKSREVLLEKADIISASIDINVLTKLEGKKLDVNSDSYQQIKRLLFNIRTSSNSYKYLYLLGMKNNGSVFFFCDSQYSDSPDYIAPGELYEEISEEYLQVFKTKQKTTVGPITDRWGTMITSLIPITNPKTGKLIAVLGLDVLDNNWQKTIYTNLLI